MLSKSCNTTKALQRGTTKSKKGKGTKKATKSQKRAATESGDDSKSESGDEPTVKSWKKAGKKLKSQKEISPMKKWRKLMMLLLCHHLRRLAMTRW